MGINATMYSGGPSASKRTFLKGTAAAMALGFTGLPILLRGATTQAQSGQQGILSGCHWGVFQGIVKDGRAVEFRPWQGDPAPSPQLPGVLDSLYSESRIRYPMVRRAWLEKGPGADPDGRGSGDFVRVSWDKAIDLVALEIARVRKEDGQQAVFAGSYGWKSPGKLHNCQTLLRRMLNLTGSYTNSTGDYSTGAAQVILPYVSGSLEVYEQCTTWNNLAKNCELMVFWGCNPLNNSQISWQVADHGAWPGVEALKKAGTKVLCIDPVRTETCMALNGEWLAPNPQTDVAMMLGIAHTLYTEGLHDQKFLDRYTTGFDKFLPYLMGTSDNTPKTAEWAAQICGLQADTLRDLAHRFAKHRTMLALGYSTQRQHHGEQIHWMLITLASMLGQIGLPGGGYGLSYHYASGGAPTATTPILKSIDDASGQKQEGAAWLASSGAVSIPVSRLVETLLNPGKTMQFNGNDIKLPVIKLAYWVGGNPFSHQQDRNEMLRAWRNLDTFIVHDVQWTATARHADIVLPATTSYERNDIEQVGDYALSHIVPMKKIVDPVFEARNDFDIFAAIAAKLGKGYEFTQGRTEMDWVRGLYEAAKIESRGMGMEMPVFDVFWNSNKPLAFPVSPAQVDFVRYADYRADPLLNALGTASGKFELYSKAIEKYHYDDCPPHATWMEPIERVGGPTTKLPLHIAANHPTMRLHSQLCGTVNRQHYAIAGREPCWMNPADAKARGLSDGDVVRVFNQRGQILAGLKITEDIRPGVIRINEGGWFDPMNPREIGSLDCYGDVNNLTTGIATSKLSQGNCGQTGVAEVERFVGTLPPVTVFSQPT
ncbi:trimethylamine-N-oxide reductase TorA [Paraburkholderia dinghuensis]|uniref:Trimethylamine-N-oxide reductase TorA n=1 Tax=Paraburkholderia dinghuensis TaxID=2305225 RepID=A0A3N6N677_9BURK|nr:trimethylamine-N-oxide reductase TorA [Paraburkholderia dinghuensis]RQH04422.1 trimethylamine-N-oxide reductase TorA [Paraburkholderia dinghuensis]